MSETITRRVTVEEILDLRHQELRKGLPIESARFDDDLDPTIIHFASFAADQPHKAICCASFLIKNDRNQEVGWKLRGMATADTHQRKGLGTSLLQHAEKELLSERPDIRFFWCYARESAIGFYERQKWECASDQFEITGAGPHRKMTKRI